MGNGKQKTEKKDKPKAAPLTPEKQAELATGHKDKVKHCVKRLDTWLEKTIKAVKSKKYPLSEAQRDKVLAHIDESYSQFKAIMAGEDKKEEFELD